MDAAFLKSLWIGLSIAAPVGPIGLLVIQRTLHHGRWVGLATGMGAAVADSAYGAVGAFGVSALINALQQVRVPLALLGGGFLLWLAWRTWHAEAPAKGAELQAGPGLAASFGQPAADLVEPGDDPVVRGHLRRPGRIRIAGCRCFALADGRRRAGWLGFVVAVAVRRGGRVASALRCPGPAAGGAGVGTHAGCVCPMAVGSAASAGHDALASDLLVAAGGHRLRNL